MNRSKYVQLTRFDTNTTTSRHKRQKRNPTNETNKDGVATTTIKVTVGSDYNIQKSMTF